MRRSKLRIDMNLLQALDALLDERSVSAAAQRLHLSQPAMSRTLTRIRAATRDPILIRNGHHMVPSARAERIRDDVADLVGRARRLLAPDGPFSPLTLDRTFTIRCHDALMPKIGSGLVRRLQVEAPSVRLRLLGEGATDIEDLRQGIVDLDVGSAKEKGAGLRAEIVATDRLVAAMRPVPSKKRKLSLVSYAALPHVIVSRRGRTSDPVDQALARHGLSRSVVATVGTSGAALSIVRDAEAVTAVAERACAELAKSMGLALNEIPVQLEPLSIVMSWREHFDGDPSHQWLRTIVGEICAG